VFAVIPAVGQAEIRGATLEFVEINITNPRDEFFDLGATIILAKLEPLGGTIQRELQRLLPRAWDVKGVAPGDPRPLRNRRRPSLCFPRPPQRFR